MKRNKKRNCRKRMERKRMNRKKRNKQKMNSPRVEWLTDRMFSVHFDDKEINKIFPSITVEVVDDDYAFPYDEDENLFGKMESGIDEADVDSPGIIDLN